MRTLRRSQERERHERGKQQRWLTFPVLTAGALHAAGFGGLVLFNEDRLPPGGSLRSGPARDLEIVTYVREGALAFRDSLGCTGLIQAGEFQCSSGRRGVRRTASNPSRTDAAHVFQMFLRPAE